MKLWIFSELYYPEESATGYFFTKIAEGLSDKYDVNVLCSQPNYSQRGVKASKYEVHKNVKIYRCFSTTMDKNNLISRFINIISINFSFFTNALLKVRSNDIVFAVTNPPTLPFIALFVSKLKGARFLFRIDDVYPDVMLVSGLLKKNWLYNLLYKMSIYLYNKAEKIIVLGRDMEKLVAERTHDKKKIIVITNWGQVDELSPDPVIGKKFLSEIGLQEKFILLWAGNMGYPHDVETLLGAIKLLSDRTEIHFLFIGSGFKRKWFEKNINAMGLNNVTLLKPMLKSEQQIFLNACDLGISSLLPNMRGISVPSRAYNYFATGKPILSIGDEFSELDFLIKEHDIGWTVPSGEKQRLAGTILEAYKNEKERLKTGIRARLIIEKYFSKQVVLNKYNLLFENM